MCVSILGAPFRTFSVLYRLGAPALATHEEGLHRSFGSRALNQVSCAVVL